MFNLLDGGDSAALLRDLPTREKFLQDVQGGRLATVRSEQCLEIRILGPGVGSTGGGSTESGLSKRPGAQE